MRPRQPVRARRDRARRAVDGRPPCRGAPDALAERVTEVLSEGKPLVVTVHVALCDNESQGIVKVKNPKICDGDRPGSNLYRATSGGLAGTFGKAGYDLVHEEKHDEGDLAVLGVFSRTFKAGKGLEKKGYGGKVKVLVVGLGYRGTRIERAMSDFLWAVGHDGGPGITLDDGTSLPPAGDSHVVGYIGHNYLMDVGDDAPLLSQANGDAERHRGVFALACLSDDYLRSTLDRPWTHIMVLNKSYAYPGAWTVEGLVRGLVAGKNGKGIHLSAAKAFATGKGKPLSKILGSFTHG